jgi:hypothetical protein
VELPKYKEYYEMLHLIFNLRISGALDIHEFVLNNVSMIHIEFYSEKDAKSPDARKLKQLLRIPKDAEGFYLSETFPPCSRMEGDDLLKADYKPHYRANCPLSRTVHLETRSILKIARFLSYSIDVPEEDFKKGYAYRVDNPDGTPYDMTELFNNLFKVYSSDNEPSDTYIKVRYKNHWFYIKNSDVHSKITFTFLQRLMTLIAGSQGGSAQSAPVLTIPVGA